MYPAPFSKKAKTWGEFQKILPKEVFESFPFWYDGDIGGRIYSDGKGYSCIDPAKLDEYLKFIEGDEDHCVIKSSDELAIWDMADFEYPMWVLARTWNEFSKDFMDKFASDEAHPASGSWIEYPMDKYEEMKNYLADKGFTVERIEYAN